MNISIVFAHFKTGKMSAYTVSQLLKYKGNHNIEILICDNNERDGSIEYLSPFKEEIKIYKYPNDKLQSHGIAYNMLFEHVSNEWVLCLESDSYATKNGYIDYYQQIIENGYDMATSYLKLSGGSFGHVAGGLYKKSLWQEMKQYCDSMPYKYFPNMSMRDNFPMHTMVHESILDQFLDNPEDWIELSNEYKPYSRKLAEEKLFHYSPTCGPFHDGRGGRQESIHTFGQRNAETEAPYAIYNEKWQKIIGRIGEEPGQALYYWAKAKEKKIFHIPTEVHWLPGKENQQQEYTLNEAGIRHEWAISAYHNYTPDNEKDVALYKQSIPDKLYNSLPEHQKIKL